MALGMSKKEINQLNALKKKQRTVKREKARFKKMILENKEFVLEVLRENDFAVQREQGGPGVHPGI
ncbi:hypothetical protein [Butyrivibrio sp. FC2001]|uniref:hypothetical protein n=1 Tax=Butyrivibrio sp. FC2001 TaxID=1280671 RepID=UPI000410B610|nr:hypothetical protein [Butyrivibrio sp. FC2001]